MLINDIIQTMSNAETSLARRTGDGVLEFSKTIDKITMPISGVLYVAGFPAAGTVFVLSALTYVGADKLQSPTK